MHTSWMKIQLDFIILPIQGVSLLKTPLNLCIVTFFSTTLFQNLSRESNPKLAPFWMVLKLTQG